VAVYKGRVGAASASRSFGRRKWLLGRELLSYDGTGSDDGLGARLAKNLAGGSESAGGSQFLHANVVQPVHR